MSERETDSGRLFWPALAAIVAAGAWLRFRLLGEPSLWLDELLNYDIVTGAAKQPWYAWLVGFEVENGPLYYALQLAARVVSDIELSSRLAPALIGTATVGLLGIAGHRINPPTGIIAAILLATSPLHVYYSREGRAYALLMFFAALVCLGFLRESARIVIAALAGAAFCAASAAPLILATAIAALIHLPFSRRHRFNVAAIVGAIAAAAILTLHYLKFTRPKPALGMPPFDYELLSKIVNGFTTTALETAPGNVLSWIIVAIGIAGGVLLIPRDRPAGAAIASMALLPLVLTLVSLAVMRHWFSIRYVSPALPAFLLLVAVGVESLAAAIKRRGIANSVAVAGGVAIAASGVPNALHEPLRKVDWRGAASYIASHARPGDPVVASNDWSMICASFYLRQLGSPIRVASAKESPETMKGFVAERYGWIVEGGWHSNPSIVEWLTNFCEVWTSPTTSQFESLRVRFYPDCRAFLDQRVTPNDVVLLQRWFIEERKGRLEMTDYDERFLLSGFADPEVDPSGPTFRWINGRRASVLIPAIRSESRIRFRARALGYPNAPPQNVVVFVNGRQAFATTLADRWSEHEMVSNALRKGVNEVVFEFSRANRPMDIDPNATDERTLSAAFDFIELSDERRE